jgi:hypothetical protein
VGKESLLHKLVTGKVEILPCPLHNNVVLSVKTPIFFVAAKEYCHNGLETGVPHWTQILLLVYKSKRRIVEIVLPLFGAGWL